MNSMITVAAMLALLGAGVIGGVFFAFSSFVMKALARVPSSAGIAAMQSINVVVINPAFIGAFIGTALLSLAVIMLVLLSRTHPATVWFLAGAVFYSAGTFLVTVFGNVPLNDHLAAVSATDPAAIKFWGKYVDRWTMWNHIRTAAAIFAAVLFGVGLMQTGGI